MVGRIVSSATSDGDDLDEDEGVALSFSFQKQGAGRGHRSISPKTPMSLVDVKSPQVSSS